MAIINRVLVAAVVLLAVTAAAAKLDDQRFYAVVGSVPTGPFSLIHAKNILHKYPRGNRPPSRAIFEVINGVIVQDPHRVGGENQGLALNAGFNRYWTGWDDINRMYAILKQHIQAYYIVAGNDAKGPLTLAYAKNILNKYPQGAIVPSRAIFEVKDGAVVKDPHHSGGQNQGVGVKAGFNKYWHDGHDIN